MIKISVAAVLLLAACQALASKECEGDTLELLQRSVAPTSFGPYMSEMPQISPPLNMQQLGYGSPDVAVSAPPAAAAMPAQAFVEDAAAAAPAVPVLANRVDLEIERTSKVAALLSEDAAVLSQELHSLQAALQGQALQNAQAAQAAQAAEAAMRALSAAPAALQQFSSVTQQMQQQMQQPWGAPNYGLQQQQQQQQPMMPQGGHYWMYDAQGFPRLMQLGQPQLSPEAAEAAGALLPPTNLTAFGNGTNATSNMTINGTDMNITNGTNCGGSFQLGCTAWNSFLTFRFDTSMAWGIIIWIAILFAAIATLMFCCTCLRRSERDAPLLR